MKRSGPGRTVIGAACVLAIVAAVVWIARSTQGTSTGIAEPKPPARPSTSLPREARTENAGARRANPEVAAFGPPSPPASGDPAAEARGLVVDAASAPVAGAEVRVLSEPSELESGEVRTVTAADGTFRLPVAGQRRVYLTAAHAERGLIGAQACEVYAGREVRMTLYSSGTLLVFLACDSPSLGVESVRLSGYAADGTKLWRSALCRTEGEWLSVSNLPPGELELDFFAPSGALLGDAAFSLREGETSVLDAGIACGCLVEGTVLDSGGRPLEGARVSADERFRKFASTSERGRFSVAIDSSGAGSWVYCGSDGHVDERAWIECGALETVVELQRAARLRGRVETAEGAPLADASVVAFASGEAGTTGFVATASTEADGGYALTNLAAHQTWLLEISHKDYAPEMLSAVTGAVDSTVELETVRLTSSGGIAGTVSNAEGMPVPFARVEVMRRDRAMPPEDLDELSATAWLRYASRSLRAGADASGAFLLLEQPPGPCEVRAVGGESQPVQVQVVPGELARARLVLEGRFEVFGQITDPMGAPVVGVDVVVFSERDNSFLTGAEANGMGRFSCFVDRPGPYRVVVGPRAAAGGDVFDMSTRPSTGVSGAVLRGVMPFESGLDVELDWATPLTGIVLDHHGDPLESAIVGASAQGDTLDWVATRSDGTFELFLPEGTSVVRLFVTPSVPDPRSPSGRRLDPDKSKRLVLDEVRVDGQELRLRMP